MGTNDSLWEVAEQTARLAELISQAAPLKEAPLRRDVRSLGRLLGAVLKEQAGEELFESVEELRRLTTRQREAARDGQTDERDELMARAEELVRRADVVEAYRLTKAFSIYFELTNLAEKIGRASCRERV